MLTSERGRRKSLPLPSPSFPSEDMEIGAVSQGQEFEKGFKRLLAWQKALELTAEVYQVTAGFPRSEMRVISQLRDAATSIGANIAEGYARATGPDYLRFLSYAHGSLAEVGSRLETAYAVGLIALEDQQRLETVYSNAGYFLRRLIDGVAGKVHSGQWNNDFLVREGMAEYQATSDPSLLFPPQSSSPGPETEPSETPLPSPSLPFPPSEVRP